MAHARVSGTYELLRTHSTNTPAPVTSCVILGKLITVSEFSFTVRPHLSGWW